MTRLLAFLLPLAGGCIIYDTDGKCWDCAPDEGGVHGNDGGVTGPDEDTAATDDTGGEDPVVVKFALDPSSAYPGDVFIAHLSDDSDAFDLGQVASAEFLNDVVILAMEPDEGELLMTLQVAHDAQPGTVDLLLHMADGRTEYVPAPLTVLEGQGQNTGSGDTGGCP